MLLLGVLLALLAAGLWMYGLIDVLLTPGPDCRTLRKGTWLAVAGLLSVAGAAAWLCFGRPDARPGGRSTATPDRKSTRLNSSHRCISYAVFCLKKKKRDSTYSPAQRSPAPTTPPRAD